MRRGMIALIVLLVIAAGLLLVILYVIGTYNVLVGLRNQVDNAWSQIDVQLKRRAYGCIWVHRDAWGAHRGL